MGTIKFISGNPEFLHEMMGKGAVEILMSLIKQVNENTKKSGTCLPNSGHLLVQVSILLKSVRLVKLVFMLSNITYLPGGCNRWAVTTRRWECLASGIRAAVPAPPPPCVCLFPLEGLFCGFLYAAGLQPVDNYCRYPTETAGLKNEYLAPLQLHVIIRILTGRVWTFRVSFL